MINTREEKGLPRLGWIGIIDKASVGVRVIHGPDVDIGHHFIVEGVWDGDFSDGNFHTSDNFFGSGLRVDTDGVWLVPSTALVDRLLLAEDDTRYYASNSLVCLMAYLGAEPDPENNYKKQADAILSGVNDYDPVFPVNHHQISHFRQIFYHAVNINGEGQHQTPRAASHPFQSFEHYQNRLRQSLQAIRKNSRNKARRKPLLAYTTISRGYDSTATTVLTRDLAITKAFTSRRSSSGIPAWLSPNAAIDDGSHIARQLGLDIGYLDYNPKDIGEDEPLFICPSPAEPELAFYRACREIRNNDQPSIMFTGYHGDKLWCRSPGAKYLDSAIIRGDTSGMNLSEARLESGFINVPVPFMYASEIASLNRISNASEMSPWSVPGDYDRPIPRRIAEEAGVPRADFGTRKKAVISFQNLPVNQACRQQFLDFLEDQFGITASEVFLHTRFETVWFLTRKAIVKLLAKAGLPVTEPLSRSNLDLPYKMHLWALHHQVDARKRDLESGSQPHD